MTYACYGCWHIAIWHDLRVMVDIFAQWYDLHLLWLLTYCPMAWLTLVMVVDIFSNGMTYVCYSCWHIAQWHDLCLLWLTYCPMPWLTSVMVRHIAHWHVLRLLWLAYCLMAWLTLVMVVDILPNGMTYVCYGCWHICPMAWLTFVMVVDILPNGMTYVCYGWHIAQWHDLRLLWLLAYCHMAWLTFVMVVDILPNGNWVSRIFCQPWHITCEMTSHTISLATWSENCYWNYTFAKIFQ